MENFKVIKTELEYKKAINRTIEIFYAQPNSAEFEELEVLLLLVKDYEEKHILVPTLNPIEVLKLKMEEKGLKANDLQPYIGTKSYVSLVLSGKRELTLKMVKSLHKFLGIPYDVFMVELNP